MLEADITTWMNTILFLFIPVITVFIAGAIMLSDLSWNDDARSGLITPIYSYPSQGA